MWGRNIRLQREARGWCQEQLAANLDVQQGTVSRWEAGVLCPRDDHRDAIADLFKIDYTTLFPRARA